MSKRELSSGDSDYEDDLQDSYKRMKTEVS